MESTFSSPEYHHAQAKRTFELMKIHHKNGDIPRAKLAKSLLKMHHGMAQMHHALSFDRNKSNPHVVAIGNIVAEAHKHAAGQYEANDFFAMNSILGQMEENFAYLTGEVRDVGFDRKKFQKTGRHVATHGTYTIHKFEGWHQLHYKPHGGKSKHLGDYADSRDASEWAVAHHYGQIKYLP